MQTLRNILGGSTFRKPEMTPEQWAENDAKVKEFMAAENASRRAARLAASGIPARYADAVLGYSREVQSWASEPTTGLLIQGSTGQGKTHQACAALAELAGRMTVRFTTFDDLIRACKATFENRETEEAVIARYANVGALCIDDMGKERLTEWSLPIVFAVINKRYMDDRPTIITTQYDGRTLLGRMAANGDAETGRAIISRMTSYTRVVLEGKDWRL